jgi:HSP20 family protein
MCTLSVCFRGIRLAKSWSARPLSLTISSFQTVKRNRKNSIMIIIRPSPTAHLGYHPYSNVWHRVRPNCHFYQANQCAGDAETSACKNKTAKELEATTPKNTKHVVSRKLHMAYPKHHIETNESEDSYVISMDLPGVKLQNVGVQVEDAEDAGILRVKPSASPGMQSRPSCIADLLSMTSQYDSSTLSARLTNGVLTIVLPKKEAPQPMVIPVFAGDLDEETQDNRDLRFNLDIPGVKSSDLNVKFHKGTLSLRGRRKKGMCTSGVFRSFTVDQKVVDTDKFKAYLVDGVLTVTAPRKEPFSTQSVAVIIAVEGETPTIKAPDMVERSSESNERVYGDCENAASSKEANENEWEDVVETVTENEAEDM